MNVENGAGLVEAGPLHNCAIEHAQRQTTGPPFQIPGCLAQTGALKCCPRASSWLESAVKPTKPSSLKRLTTAYRDRCHCCIPAGPGVQQRAGCCRAASSTIRLRRDTQGSMAAAPNEKPLCSRGSSISLLVVVGTDACC